MPAAGGAGGRKGVDRGCLGRVTGLTPGCPSNPDGYTRAVLPVVGQYCPHGCPFRGCTEGGLRACPVGPGFISRVSLVVGGASHIPPHCSCSTVSCGLLATAVARRVCAQTAP